MIDWPNWNSSCACLKRCLADNFFYVNDKPSLNPEVVCCIMLNTLFFIISDCVCDSDVLCNLGNSNISCFVFPLFPGAWIMTSGLREGVGRCVGEAVRDHCATASSLSQAKVIAVGVAPWGLIYQRQQLINPQVL